MKKHSLNILFFSLSLGVLVPSQAWCAEQPSAHGDTSATAVQASPAEPVQGMSAESHSAEPTKSEDAAATHALQSGSAVEEKKAHGEEANPENSTEKKKSKKKKGKKSKKHSKKGKDSSVCPPPADVVSKLDARNNTSEAPVTCAPTCETSSAVVVTENTPQD